MYVNVIEYYYTRNYLQMSFTHKLFSLVALAAAALSVTNALILSEQCGAPLADPYHWDIKNDPGLQSRKAEFLNGGNCAIVRAFDQSGQRAVAGEQDAWSPYSSWYFPNAATYWCNTEPTLGQVNYKTFTQLRPEGQGDISYIVYSGLKPLDSAEYTTVTQVRFIWRDETAGKAIEKAHPK
jgi:hypothetical protein